MYFIYTTNDHKIQIYTLNYVELYPMVPVTRKKYRPLSDTLLWKIWCVKYQELNSRPIFSERESLLHESLIFFWNVAMISKKRIPAHFILFLLNMLKIDWSSYQPSARIDTKNIQKTFRWSAIYNSYLFSS